MHQISIVDNINQYNLPPRRALEHIAIEANTAFNLKNLVQGYLPAFIRDIAQGATNLIQDRDENQYYRNFIMKDHRVAYKAQHLDYMTYGVNLVSVPEGFSGHLPTYGRTLISVGQSVQKRLPSLLTTLNSYLSQVISNGSHRHSLRDMSAVYKEVAAERDNMVAQLAVFFPKDKVGITKGQINRILERMSDVKDLKAGMDDLDRVYKGFDVHAIHAQIQESVDLANMTLKYLKEGHIEALTPAVSKTIMNGIHESALYIEFVSALIFDIIVYMKSVDNLYDHILST